MSYARWGPWSGPCRKSAKLFRPPPASSHSTWIHHVGWSRDDDLGQLQQTFLSMLSDPALSDVCLVVEGVDVPAHKAILAAWSRPFRAMFTLPMLESLPQCRVDMKDVEHKHLMVALDYLYSGRVRLNDQNVMPVYALANRYEVMPLMAQCEGYMKWRLNPSNVCRHLFAAEEHQCASMAEFALDYLAVHFEEVQHDSNSSSKNSNDFNTLAGDIILRVLQHEGLTADEETVFVAVDGWAKAWRWRRDIRGIVTDTDSPEETIGIVDRSSLHSNSSSGSSSSPSSDLLAAHQPATDGSRPSHGEKALQTRMELPVSKNVSVEVQPGDVEIINIVNGSNNGGDFGSTRQSIVLGESSGVRSDDPEQGSIAVAGMSQGLETGEQPGRVNNALNNSDNSSTISSTRSDSEGPPKDSCQRVNGVRVESAGEGGACARQGATSKRTGVMVAPLSSSALALPAASSESLDTGKGSEQSQVDQQQQRQDCLPNRSTATSVNSSITGTVTSATVGTRDRESTSPASGLSSSSVVTNDTARRRPPRDIEENIIVEDVLVVADTCNINGSNDSNVGQGAVKVAEEIFLGTTKSSMVDDGGREGSISANIVEGGGPTERSVGGERIVARLAGTPISLPPPPKLIPPPSSSHERRKNKPAWRPTVPATRIGDAPKRATCSAIANAVAAAGGSGLSIGGDSSSSWDGDRLVVSRERNKESGSKDEVVDDELDDLLPEEERVFLDELFTEVRFPLISTSFLCQVVEKSPAVSGSRVAQKLLHEAYRFQAIRPEGPDVDEHFPGNHRVKYRGHERVLFGEGDGCVGTVDDYSSSLSEVHLVENVRQRDEKYWLPGQPEDAFVCVRLDRVRRITKFRFQNRYSEEFEVAVRRTRREEWQVIVPRQPSGGHKDIKVVDLTRKRVKARHVKISLKGRKRSCYNTSLYWTELLGF